MKEILLKIEQVLMPKSKWKLENFYLFGDCCWTKVIDFCSKIQLAYKYKGGQKVYKFDLTSRNIGWKLKSIETTKRRIKRGFLFFSDLLPRPKLSLMQNIIVDKMACKISLLH